MRTLCDVCEGAAAILFCAADEAALCRACDDKVHMCNKLASRHVRVGLAEPSIVPRCDICETAPAFFYCEVDGSSLCLQCDMIVHVGGKRTHGRYLLMRQRIEFPGDKPGNVDEPGPQRVNLVEVNKDTAQYSAVRSKETQQNYQVPPERILGNHADNDGIVNNVFDLNARPQRTHNQAQNNHEQGNNLVNNNHELESVVPDEYFRREP